MDRRPNTELPQSRYRVRSLGRGDHLLSRSQCNDYMGGNKVHKPGEGGSVTNGRPEKKRGGFPPTVMGRSRRQISSPFHPHLLKLMLMGSRQTIRRVHMRRCTSEFRNPHSAFRILPRRSVWKRRVTLFLR